MRNWIGFSGLSVLLLAGCVSAANVYYLDKTSDKVDGYTKYELGKNILGGWNMMTGGSRLDLVADKLVDGKGKETYDLIVYYAGADWMHIAAGDSLRLAVDGKRMTFTGKGSDLSNKQVLLADLVTEKAFYPVTRGQIAAIAAGVSATVKVVGANGFLEKEFTRENFVYLKKFLADTDSAK